MYNVTFIGDSTIARPQIEHYEQRISLASQSNGIKVSKSQIDETKAAVTGYSGMTMITMYIRWRVGFARSAPTNNMPVPRKLNQRRTHWRVTLPNCCAIVRRTPAGSRVTSLKNNAQLSHATSTNKWGCYACKSKLHVGTKKQQVLLTFEDICI